MKVPLLIYRTYQLYHRAYCRFCYPLSRWTHINAEQRGKGPVEAFILAIIFLVLALTINVTIGLLQKGT